MCTKQFDFICETIQLYNKTVPGTSAGRIRGCPRIVFLRAPPAASSQVWMLDSLGSIPFSEHIATYRS